MFKGSIVALVTPFESTGEIDFHALQRLVAMHLDAGTDGFVIAGTTGESAALNAGEVAALLDAVIGQVAGQVPVLAGTGSPSTEKTIAATQLAESLKASAALVVTPYYNRPTQNGLMTHYRAVADNSDLPIILYNVPARTGVDLLPSTAKALASHSRIVALKEAVGTKQRTAELMQFCNNDFYLLSGDDPTCLSVLEQGAKGVVSVAANVVPERFADLCKAVAAGDLDRARTIDGEMRDLYKLLALESNPIPVKWALHEMALCGSALRLPLTELGKEYRPAIRQGLGILGTLGD